MTQESKSLKGGPFQNRYLIKATLTALTPFHIGDGSLVERTGMVDDKGEPIQINAAATDGARRAYIPGSTLRGALSDWLKQHNGGMTAPLGTRAFREKIDQIKKSGQTDGEKDAAIRREVRENSSALERIFGTQQNEGKLEVWNAYCASSVETKTDQTGPLCFWDQSRMTYVAKSVAIDPATGTADEGKLYNYELVPAGASFTAAFSAQNLSIEEAKLLLAVLKGFNHPHDPMTIGAMTKLDYGCFSLAPFKIYRMMNREEDKKKWMAKAAEEKDPRAGYELLEDESFELKGEVYNDLCNAPLPMPKDVSPYKEHWELTLGTPLVVRSGGHFLWKSTDIAKTRNYRMQCQWMQTENTGHFHQVNDLYHSVKIENNRILPYFHVPASAIRGALRSWTLEHLLPKEWRDMGVKIKEGDLSQKPRYFDDILSLFGFAVEGAEKSLSEKYTSAGRLTIRVRPFSAAAAAPTIDGEWVGNNDFGPSNAKRHIKPRNPLDRITRAAKDGGLHNNLEFSKEQPLGIDIEIRACEEFDKKLLERWEKEIQLGLITFGGLTGIGRGRVRMSGVQKEAQHG